MSVNNQNLVLPKQEISNNIDLSSTLNFETNITNNLSVTLQQINLSISKVNKNVADLDASAQKSIGNMNNGFKSINLNSMISSISNVSSLISQACEPGIGFEQVMAEVSASTGIAGQELDRLSEAARRTGKESGLGASEAAKVFSALASQLDVSKLGVEGLELLQQKSITLSKAVNVDVNDAVNSLAGTINQFGLAATDADRVINILAAGAKFGKADINDLALSFDAVGRAASSVGLTVEDTAGAIEVLSQNNIKGAQAGTALKDIMLNMQNAMGIDFSQSSLSEVLESLKPKLGDATYLSNVFGSENLAAAQYLIENSQAVQEMTDQLTNTNTAQEQAATRTATTAEKMNQWRASIDDIKIGLFDMMGSSAGMITVMGEQMVMLSQLAPLITSVGNGIQWLTEKENLRSIATGISSAATSVWTGIQWAFNAAMAANPLVWVIALVVALVGAIIVCATKVEGWGKQWDSIVNFMKAVWELFCTTLQFRWSVMTNGIMMGLDLIKLGWYKFKEACGLGESSENQAAIAAINSDIAARQQTIVDGAKQVADLAKKASTAMTWELSWKSKDGKTPVAEDAALTNGAGLGLSTNSIFGGALQKADPKNGFPTLPYGTSTTKEGNPKPKGGNKYGATTPFTGNGIKTDSLSGSVEPKGVGSNIIDLDKIKTNIKGSGTYGAITSKLGSVKMPSLATAAASMAMPLAVSGTTFGQDTSLGSMLSPTSQAMAMDEQNSSNESKLIKPEKFCDQIVINIASADGKGYDVIRGEVVNVLNEIMDDYDA